MLVLTRKLGEQIVIGDDVVVTVVALQGGKIRLGIEAPRATSIRRSELEEESPTLTVKHYRGRPRFAKSSTDTLPLRRTK